MQAIAAGPSAPVERSGTRHGRMRRCWLPSSPIACRAALIRVPSTESETMPSRQTAPKISLRLTTLSRLSIGKMQQVEDCGPRDRS